MITYQHEVWGVKWFLNCIYQGEIPEGQVKNSHQGKKNYQGSVPWKPPVHAVLGHIQTQSNTRRNFTEHLPLSMESAEERKTCPRGKDSLYSTLTELSINSQKIKPLCKDINAKTKLTTVWRKIKHLWDGNSIKLDCDDHHTTIHVINKKKTVWTQLKNVHNAQLPKKYLFAAEEAGKCYPQPWEK